MDLEEKEHVISSDEYTDDDDDYETVRAKDHVRHTNYNYQNNQPKWGIDQKQKELSSLIRRNKISVIYKNKSIKWLNNKWKRERYKQRISTKSCKSHIDQLNPITLESIELENHQDTKDKSNNQKCITLEFDDANREQMIIDKQTTADRKPVVHMVSAYNGQASILVNDEEIVYKKNINNEETNIQDIHKMRTSIEEAEEISRKRKRSPTPPTSNECTETEKELESKFKSISPQFYKSINNMFPKYDKIATNHVDSITNSLLTAVEDKMKNLSNEIEILNKILQVKEMELNRLSHLKMVKEEIYSRLNKKKHIIHLKESFANKQDKNILLELKELEFYLAEMKTTPETNNSTTTIRNLIEKRANMNADDLKREKNNTSRLHSLLVSQNMLNGAESIRNTCGISNGEKNYFGFPRKNCEIYNHLEGGTLGNNNGRPEVHDVKTLIADSRQKNSELLPGVAKQFKPTESKVHSISLLDKLLTKDHQHESYSLPNSITPAGYSKKITASHDIDIFNANNQHNIRLEDTYFKDQVKGDFNGKCPRNIQYPLCQECKIKESRFVCAGCENQWYCSKKCQISAWDNHSELCTE